MIRRLLLSVAGCFLLAAPVLRAQNTIEITVEGGKHDLKNVSVCVPLSLTREQAKVALGETPELNGGRIRKLDGQVTLPGIMTEYVKAAAEGQARLDLHFILRDLRAGEKLTLSTKLGTGARPSVPMFIWSDDVGGLDTLLYADGKSGRPVLRYMRIPYDNSSPAKRNKTYKVFHHLYAPAGTHYVTNGGDTDKHIDEKAMLYPHHRGLMFAFNRIRYGEGMKTTADTWHAKPGDTRQEHAKTLREEMGPVLGRHRVVVKWCGAQSDVFAVEERELTVYRVPGGNLVEFASRLKTTDGKVRLDGDPQHAGFQFRAANEVAGKESAKQTYYLRPDGKGAFGATRNWDPKTKAGPVDLPWDAMSFVLGGKRYTVAYLNSPQNPQNSRFSERDYGRFGCYFEYDLTGDHPLVVNYRVWLQDGEMKGEQVEALYEAFAHPPRITVKK